MSLMTSFLAIRESFSLSFISSGVGSISVGIVVLVTLVRRKKSNMLLDFCLALPSVNDMFLFSEALRVNVAL